MIGEIYFEILEKLNNSGFEAYIVGGAIRDLYLNRDIHDVDITTSRRPEEICQVFSQYKTIDVNKEFGTILLLIGDLTCEITSFRLESNYDGRKPRDVSFSRKLYDDLKRRDFTINALVMDKDGEVRDFFNGLKDLKNSYIRSIGDPKERLGEDYLRILRAIRFSSQLDFEIDGDLLRAIDEKKSGLTKISMERINQEFSKILMSDNPKKGLNLLMDLDIFDFFIGEIKGMKGFNQDSPFHKYDLWNHSLEVVSNVPKDLSLRLAALLHDIGKVRTKVISEDNIAHYYNHQKVSRDMGEEILKRLKYPNKLIGEVSNLINMHMDSMNPYSKKRVKRLLNRYGKDFVEKLFSLHRADMVGLGKGDESIFSNLIRGEAYLEEILSKGEIFESKKISIDGRDVINLGFDQGRIIGIILDDIKDKILGDELKNSREELLRYIESRYK